MLYQQVRHQQSRVFTLESALAINDIRDSKARSGMALAVGGGGGYEGGSRF